MSPMVMVINTESGREESCFAVDARERVARGGWVYKNDFPPQPAPQLSTADLAAARGGLEALAVVSDEDAHKALEGLPKDTPLTEMTVRQLTALARVSKIPVPKGINKNDLIILLSKVD